MQAADAGLLSPDLAAGIGRVKGVKQLGQRSGNWLSIEQCSDVLSRARGDRMRQKRDYAMLALLFGCGLRRSELVGLNLSDVQTRQGHWAIMDLVGEGEHIRTVPMPEWGKAGTGRLDGIGCGQGREDFSRGKPGGNGMGQGHYAERGLVRGKELLRESRARTHRTARPAAHMREAVPFQWRRA
jgi:hypothetical protein